MDDEPIVLIFDGTCGFCTRCARLATEGTPPGTVSAVPNQDPGVIERYGLTREDVDRFAWTIEPSGRRRRGAAAISLLLRRMGGAWRVLGWLAALPGAGLAYAAVARSRPLLSTMWGDAPPYPG